MDTKLNRSDYLLIAIVYTVIIILNCIDYYRSNNDLIEYLVDIPIGILFSFGSILLFMYWLIPNFLNKEKRYVSFIFLSLLVIGIAGLMSYVAGFWSGGNDWSKFPKGYNIFIISIYELTDEIGLLFGILLAKKFYEGQAQFFNIQKQQKENELKLLRSQIDPHFLFNNLNTLDALIDKDTAKAKEYINRLSLIYRYLIKTKDAEVMELANEIELAENYIFLIQTRFGEDYDFRIQKNVPLTDKFIPTGAIQTLLENVVKHNKPEGKNSIMSNIVINEGWLTVVNTKSKVIPRQESFGTGLENLKTRYKLLSDQEVQIINTEAQFKISVPIIKLSYES